MTNQEERLRSIAPGTGNPFRVPEGYFEQMPDAIMQRIHAQKQPRQSRWHRWAIAAAFAGLVSGISAVLYISDSATGTQQVATISHQTNTVNDEALDYAMVDNGEIEYYLTNE